MLAFMVKTASEGASTAASSQPCGLAGTTSAWGSGPCCCREGILGEKPRHVAFARQKPGAVHFTASGFAFLRRAIAGKLYPDVAKEGEAGFSAC